jgi:uncharacterized protein (DUF488 family)
MPTLYTIGHSNRPIDDFLALLSENEIERVADVRLLPGSRRYPQFGQDALIASLAAQDIKYTHFRTLGGRRNKRATDSPNSAWRVGAFAAYADYMLTDEFRAALHELKDIAAQSRTSIMCAEALPWQCHRRLVADQFLAEGWQVLDIIGPHNTKPHELPDFACVVDRQVTYPGTSRPLFN